MAGEEVFLLENIKEFVKKAKEAEADLAFNTATTLYFKAIAVLMDLFILRKEGLIPNNHTQRFRILESKYPQLYLILDKDFPLYQDSYRLKLGKEPVLVLENDLKKVTELTKIKI